MSFSTGVSGFDNLFPELLYSGSIVVIAGHPGAGKTTLASTICYSNALKGHRCLYVSFQESREKFYRIMKNLGMNFEELEKKGVFLGVKIPITRSVEEIIETISRIISSWNPKIVVIDSINALLQAVESSDRRAWLQNYFYAIPEITKGVIILIAELPIGVERIELGSIEFVADSVIILKHKIERGLLSRYIEIRKARGSPITLAEIPYTILPGQGFKIFIPPILAEVGRPGKELKPPCKVFEKILDHIHMGHSIYVEYPADFRILEAVPLVLGIAFRNNLKVLIISYIYSPETMTDLILKAFSLFEVDKNKLRSILEEKIVFKSLNPYAYSIMEGLAEEYQLIDKSGADMVIFHSVEIPALVESRDPSYIVSLYNQINILKQQHKIIVRIASKINDELSNMFSVLSDIILKFMRATSDQNYILYVWRRGSTPAMLSIDDIYECLREVCLYLL